MKRFASFVLALCICNSLTAMASATSIYFADIEDSAYYIDAVEWAVENNITNGTSTNLFSPDATCTRGQVVTFLWRANGHPVPTVQENPFIDVESEKYYYTPVMWAYSQQIVSGTSDNTFSPEEICTKEQIITMIWRSLGKPISRLSTKVDCSKYAKEAVAFFQDQRVANNINGFENCSRADTVYYIYTCKKIKLHRPGELIITDGARSIKCQDCDFQYRRFYIKDFNPADTMGAFLNLESGQFYIFENGDYHKITVEDNKLIANGHVIGRRDMLITSDSTSYAIYRWSDDINFRPSPYSDLGFEPNILEFHGSAEWEQAKKEIMEH